MTRFLKLALCLPVILFSLSAKAGRPEIKFGVVTANDFATNSYPVDPNADAVVLAHFGDASYEGDNKGGFSVIYKYHLRIRLLNRKSFDEGTVEIPLYLGYNGMEEKLEKLDAFTFNIVNGSVEKTKLDNNSIFKDKIDKKHMVKKFTMPNLQEGCIIDIRYTINSPFERAIEPWYFQGEYPVLWSEFSVAVPELYDYTILSQGYHPYKVRDSKSYTLTYNLMSPNGTGANDYFTYKANVVNSTWAMENVPAMKPESFTTTVNNHLAKLSFQLSKIRYPNSPVRDVMNNWMTAASDFMKDPSFGEELNGSLGWLKSELKTITAGATTETDIAKSIYTYVRDNFTCTSHRGVFKSASLKKIFQAKTGSVADINLLLTAMLTAQGFDAHPVIASTRDNGYMYEAYPVEERMNYVVSNVLADSVKYNLDASYRKLGFGKLPTNVYNGSARMIDRVPYIVNLSPDSLQEMKLTSIFFLNREDNSYEGFLTSTLGDQESYEMRERLAKTDSAEVLKDIIKGYTGDIKAYEPTFEQLKEYDQPVVVKYNLKPTFTEDIIYLNPLLSEATKTNPFKAEERLYPVEMPYAINEIITVRMDIPKGYTVDELPKSTRVKFNEDEGMFEYLVSNNGGIIQVRTVIKLNKATFLPEDYQSLRDFFGFIVKKQSEQIVLKKTKA
jgi:hypothetical protein